MSLVGGRKGAGLMFSYSMAQGVFAGIYLEGSMVVQRPFDNHSFYENKNATVAEILEGKWPVPNDEKKQKLVSDLHTLLNEYGSGKFERIAFGGGDYTFATNGGKYNVGPIKPLQPSNDKKEEHPIWMVSNDDDNNYRGKNSTNPFDDYEEEPIDYDKLANAGKEILVKATNTNPFE